MKKIFIFILLAFIPLSTFANDGYGISYDIVSDKISCVIVENASDFNNGGDLYLYFNYSKKVGEKLGRPWTLVEPNKCYEYGGEIEYNSVGEMVDFGSEFYLIKTKDRNFINYLNTDAKNKFNQIPYYISKKEDGDYYLDYKVDNSTQVYELDDYGDGLRRRGLSGQESLVNVLDSIDYDLFKYNFGEGIVGGSSASNFERALNFLEKNNYTEELKTLFFHQDQVIQSLKNYKIEISNIYNRCLSDVKRIETKINITTEKTESEYLNISVNFLGRYLRKTDDKLNLFENIEQINNLMSDSCKNDLQSAHLSNIKKVNEKGDDYYGYVKSIEKLLNSASNLEIDKYLKEYYSIEPEGLTEEEKNSYFPKNLDDAISINNNVKKFDLLINESEIKEIKEEKTDVKLDSEDVSTLQKTKNNFSDAIEENNYTFILYMFLPLLAILGLYFALKKRK